MKRLIFRIFVSVSILFIGGGAFVSAQHDLAQGTLQAEGQKVSLDLKGMDVVEVIKMLATKGSFSVIVGSGVQGRVTMFLKDVDISDAFEIVLLSNNLACDQRGDILYILTQRDYEAMYGERYADKKEVKIFRLKYAKAQDMAKSLNMMKSKVGKLIVDDGSNTLVVIDSPIAVAQIAEAVEKLDIPLVTKIYELKYAKAEDMKAKIQESLTKGVGTIQIDVRTNKIAVSDVETRMEEISKMVEAFDSKLQQVLIEAKILEITLSDQYKLGIDWDVVTREFQNQLKNSMHLTNTFKLAAAGSLIPGAQVLIGTFNSGAYAAMIQALKTVGDANVLSSPRITALNNQEAKILVGSNTPYATNTVTQGTATTTVATSLTFLDIGVKLFVTPTINKDGFVTMKIRPEVSSKSGDYTYGSPSTTVPVVSTTQAETSVVAKDGATIIIAGLIKDERSNSVSKVPIMGNLPLIGVAFRKTDKTVAKKELVIFITPHIISGETDYIKQPMTAPIGEKKFTVAEDPAFERRVPKAADPTYLKKKYEEWQKQEPARTSEIASSEQYFKFVRAKIMENLTFPGGAKGIAKKDRVKVRFALYSGGNLASKPEAVESSSDLLAERAVNAVLVSEPFPRFPPSMKELEKSFTIDIVYD